jgi:hypothetical protein
MAKDKDPRISVNKLAEYVGAKGARQRQILRDQKFPSISGMYYAEASTAVAACLASNMEDTSMIARAIRILEQKTPDKAGAMRRITANIDALEAFEAMLDDIDLKQGTPELGEHRPEKLTMHGVEISVRPDIVLRGNGKSGKQLVGAVKVHFSRTFPMTDASAGYVAAVLQRYSEDKLIDGNEVVGSDYCFVIDVGSGNACKPVKATAARLKDIEAECRNIAALWPTITKDE